ncbi:NCS1 nucleoside transporter [Seiridium cupressi]
MEVSATDVEKDVGAIRHNSVGKPLTPRDEGNATVSHLRSQSDLPPKLLGRLASWNTRLESLSGFEARGIMRVPPSERLAPSLWDDISIALLWFSANISVNNLAVGLFGPLVFGLGFLDSAMCAVFGGLLGSLSTAYMSTWGPASGNRTMVVLRFFMGYWPAKVPTFLNIVLMVGYCTIDAILGGQMLSAINGGGMSIAVGIVVVQLVGWVVAVFGMRFFHTYERFAWVPQLIVLLVLVGTSAKSFNTETKSTGSHSMIAANRLSFLSLCLYVPNSWGAAASDFYVYYPESTSKTKIFLLTLTGLWLSFTLVFLIGIGLATSIPENTEWQDAYAVSTGALVVEAFDPLKGFGRFCGVVVALGVIANSIPGTYAAALGCQVLGRYGKAVPRWVWSCLLTLVELVLALAGREHLLVIMQNFLALMGYWIQFMVTIVLMEHLWVRKEHGFDWARWEDKAYLPIGVAALISFLLGWMGAILGMYQVWYVGPLAEALGLADVGLWTGTLFTLIVHPPLRWVELKYLKR